MRSLCTTRTFLSAFLIFAFGFAEVRAQNVPLAALLLLALAGCQAPQPNPFSSKPEHPPPPQTTILRVEVEPNPVAVGDTARFTVVIEDSLDQRFRYRWNSVGDVGEVVGHSTDVSGSVTTSANFIRWVPDTVTSRTEYRLGVVADNGSQDSTDVPQLFTVTTSPDTASR